MTVARGDGLRVRLTRIPGVTPKSVLRAPYYFQCPPLDEFTRNYGHEHSRYRTASRGEFSERGGRSLRTIPLRTLAAEWGRFVTEFNFDVEGLTNALIKICEQGYPVHILATHRYNDEPEIDMDCVIETLAVTEKAGEEDARYFDLSIAEWRDPVVARRGLTKKRRGSRHYPFTIKLRANGTYSGLNTKDEDLTLAVIAKYGYGRPSLWRQIADDNQIRSWGQNTPLIRHSRFKGKGGKLIVQKPILATTNPPDGE